MDKHFGRLRCLVLVAAGVLCLLPGGAPAATRNTEFLTRDGCELYLNGKPFHEISFNKYDLVLEMFAGEEGRSDYGPNPALSAETALKNLHAYGFKTLRAFAFCHGGAAFLNPVRKARYLAALDKTLDLCDKYDLRLVLCLNATDIYFWKSQGETLADLVGNSRSKSRKVSEAVVGELVDRYRDRKTIAAWEHENELLYKADSGNTRRECLGMKVPTLAEVIRFHAEMAAFIRARDPNHLITTGDSYRESLWHQSQFIQGLGKSQWAKDTPEQLLSAVSAAQAAVDLFCVHDYINIHHVEPRVCGPADWVRVANAAGKPVYYGEYGSLPVPRNEKTKAKWDKNPGWFTSYEGDEGRKAEAYFARGIAQFLAAKPSLVHWWTYQHDAAAWQKDPNRGDISLERTPRLFHQIAEANRQLQLATMGFTYVTMP
jgi:hypothetical protein